MKFDKEISVPTLIAGAVVGYLAGPKIGMSAEAAAAVAGGIGYLVDFILFKVKTRLEAKKG